MPCVDASKTLHFQNVVGREDTGRDGCHDFPVLVAQRDQVAVVVEVEEVLARAARLLTGQVR
jgi:hypothetical protein